MATENVAGSIFSAHNPATSNAHSGELLYTTGWDPAYSNHYGLGIPFKIPTSMPANVTSLTVTITMESYSNINYTSARTKYLSISTTQYKSTSSSGSKYDSIKGMTTVGSFTTNTGTASFSKTVNVTGVSLVPGTQYYLYIHHKSSTTSSLYYVTGVSISYTYYTVTYNANGGSGAPSSQRKTPGVALTLSSTSPTRSNYNFKGWGTSSTTSTVSYSPGGSYTTDADITLYAVWEAIIRTLTINPNGGTWGGSTSNSTKTGTTSSTLSIAAPTRPGYIFAGWFKTAYGSLSNSTSTNPIFTSSSSLPSVYNNSSDGTVTHTRQSDTGAGYSYTIKITTSNASAQPGLGGFHTATSSASGATFIHYFRAKVPKGYTLNHHNNAVGTGSKFTWLTSREGTGAWADYAYKLECGTSGTFSTFGYIALAEATAPVTWYLGGTQITKNPTSAQTFTFGAGNTTLYARWIPQGLVQIYNGSSWQSAIPYIYNGSSWQQAIPYVYNGSEWKVGG